jgi:methylmalonyl-CoA mutase N-terminal domain/subunit
VGVNRFETEEDPPEVEGYEMDEKARIRQLERLADVKRSRSAADVRDTLAALDVAAVGSENLMPLLVDCAKAYCTVGEMVAVLKERWGEFRQPAVF